MKCARCFQEGLSGRYCSQCGSVLQEEGSLNGDSMVSPLGRRFVAMVLDALIVSAFLFFATPFLEKHISGYQERNHSIRESIAAIDNLSEWMPGRKAILAGTGDSLMWLLVMVLYYTLMEGSFKMATFGKMVMHLRVTDNNGCRLGYHQAFQRATLRAISVVTVVGLLIALIGRKNKALHDFYPGSMVLVPRKEVASVELKLEG